MTGHAYHHGSLRAVLLAHAWDAVDSAGAEALSLRQLAREAGVSHSASARHFRDRQALLDAVAVEGFGRLNAAVHAAADSEAPFAGRFRESGLAYVGFAVAHPRVLAVMYTAKHHAAASEALHVAARTGMRELVALVAAAQSAGEVRPGDPEEFATAAFASVHGLAALATAGLLENTPALEAAVSLTGLVWEGLAVREPSREPPHPPR